MIEEVTSVENESACACLCVLISSEHLTCLATRLSSLPLLFRLCLNPTLSASLSVTDTHAHTHILLFFQAVTHCHTVTLSLRQILCESVPRIHPHHPTDRPTVCLSLSPPVSPSLPLSLSLCPKSNRNTTLTLSHTNPPPYCCCICSRVTPSLPFSLSLSFAISVHSCCERRVHLHHHLHHLNIVSYSDRTLPSTNRTPQVRCSTISRSFPCITASIAVKHQLDTDP